MLDIGLPPGLSEEQAVGLELLTPEWVSARLPERPLDSHKGSYGHALIVAGSRNYVGAACLSSQASVRTGAGLTTLASPVGVHPIAASRSVEAIHLPLPEDADGRTSPEAALVVRESARRYSALAVGCGLGWSAGTTAFVERLLCEAAPALPTLPILVDADGLNNLSQVADWPRRVALPLVLTPHPGEMSTLTGLTSSPDSNGPGGRRQEMGPAMGRLRGVEGGPYRDCGPWTTGGGRPFRQPRLGHRRHGRRVERSDCESLGPGSRPV